MQKKGSMRMANEAALKGAGDRVHFCAQTMGERRKFIFQVIRLLDINLVLLKSISAFVRDFFVAPTELLMVESCRCFVQRRSTHLLIWEVGTGGFGHDKHHRRIRVGFGMGLIHLRARIFFA